MWLSIVGNVYIDAKTNKQYRCTANITISPTLINDRVTTYGVWNPLISYGDDSGSLPNTFVLEDEGGNQIVAVLVDGEVDFTATPNDIRKGKVAATDDGVTVGEKIIPTYIVSQGTKVIMAGNSFSIRTTTYDLYNYTKLQAMLCPFISSISKSVSCEKVVIDDNLYDVLSTVSISEIQLDHDNKSIEFGIMNDTDSPYLIRYFSYKEVE